MIGNMRRPSAEFVVLILLFISFICGEAGPSISSRSHVRSAKRIVRPGSMQRKILQDQRTPIWAEPKNAIVQKAESKQVDERKWEAKEKEKKEWIVEPKEHEEAVYQEKKTDREQIMVGKKNEPWHQGARAEKEETRVEQNDEEWLQELEAEGEQINVKQETLYPQPKAESDQTQVEKSMGEALQQDPKAQGEEINVDRKEQGKANGKRKIEREVVGKVEPSAGEKSEKWEEKPVSRFKDDEWKVANVGEKEEELWKKILVDERKKEPEEEEQREDSRVNKEEPKEKMEEEPRTEDIREAPKVEQKNLEPNPEIRKEEKLGENDDRQMESKKVESQVEEEALKMQDKKEANVELKNENKKYKDRKPSISSEIEEVKPVETDSEEDVHSDFDEDYPDFLDELRNFPERFQKTAESVKDQIRYSGLDKYTTHSKELFNQANQQMQESFTPLLGKDYAPFLAYLVSYGLLLLPLALVTYLLDRIRARFSLQKVLLFVNIYLSAYFAALLAVALVLDSEPINFFMEYSSSSYICLQLLQAFGYLIYLLLNTADLISTCSNGLIPAKFLSVLQWVVVIALGFHYYVTVFHRAMARKAPLTGWKNYGLYSVSFVFLCLFARIERGKKQYTPREVDATTDKKN